ncbi:MAG: DUF4974 domain-containing protein [Bacteroides intestinalis]|nr:DUF4974 domain-containing protein [Bacteroides intestinalis]
MDERVQQYFREELTPAERLAFLREVEANASLKEEFMEFQNMHALMSLSSYAEDKEESKEGYMRFLWMKKKKQARDFIIASMKYAAVLICIVLSTYWVSTRCINPFMLGAEMNTLYVPAGQRARITLQDGTMVWLNAQSTLTYPSHFIDKNRRVSLIGEGYFEVAKDTEKPFIVSVSQVEMTVLGTKFNVYSYPDAGYTQTSLLEGSLLVSSVRSGTQIVLKPEEQVTVRDGRMMLGKIKHPDAFLWKEGIYSFDDEPLGDIARKLELYYDVKIIIKTPRLADIRYTCKFRQRDGIDEILQLISKVHKFKIMKDKENNIITLF